MTVILDAGHGINTAGKGSPYALHGVAPELYLREYQYNRWIVDAIARELRYRGIKVEKVVKNDFDMPLGERVQRINNIYRKDKDSFLVSVHVNAAGNGRKWMNASYWAIFTSIGKTESDTIAEYIWNSAKRTFSGKCVNSQLKDGDHDFEENFYILKNTYCPAVLTENFFQDNVKDVEYLLSEKGMKAVIKCHVDGIIDYINSRKK